jgi:hypothetical protein
MGFPSRFFFNRAGATFPAYVPPARKSSTSENARMGIFDAAALAWMFFQSINGERAVPPRIDKAANRELGANIS